MQALPYIHSCIAAIINVNGFVEQHRNVKEEKLIVLALNSLTHQCDL